MAAEPTVLQFRELVEHQATHRDQNWSRWWPVLLPHPAGIWYLGGNQKPASITQIPRDELPGSRSGVYEIGVSIASVPDRIISIYAGRARDNYPDGNHLRNRLGRYIKNGFDLGPELRFFLNQGCVIHVRWCFFGPLSVTDAAERFLLGSFDYALNTHQNGISRTVYGVMWNHDITIEKQIQNQYPPEPEPEEEVKDPLPVDEIYFLYESLSDGDREKIKKWITGQVPPPVSPKKPPNPNP